MGYDEFRVEITIRVVPRDTAKKIGRGHTESVFKDSDDTVDIEKELALMAVKAYEQARKEARKHG